WGASPSHSDPLKDMMKSSSANWYNNSTKACLYAGFCFASSAVLMISVIFFFSHSTKIFLFPLILPFFFLFRAIAFLNNRNLSSYDNLYYLIASSKIAVLHLSWYGYVRVLRPKCRLHFLVS